MATTGKSLSRSGTPTVAITMGDPAGVGPELCLRTLADSAVARKCTGVVFGSAAVLGRVAVACDLPQPSCVITPDQWRTSGGTDRPCVVDIAMPEAQDVQPGQIDIACGRAAYAYIEAATEAALAGKVAAVVTAPIHKEALNLAGIAHPGHTEILAQLTKTTRYCMMLASDDIAVSFVTTHMSLAKVAQTLSIERVSEVIALTAEAVGQLRHHAPRLVVCGFNPHAGEHGLFGDEEARAITPAVEAARAAGMSVEGPVPPDTVFIRQKLSQYDAVVCMYHDQGHIPFKMLAFDTGVNITLGLPIVRTSVDHGTAFDIAWRGRAKPTSLFAAIDMAVSLAEARPTEGPAK